MEGHVRGWRKTPLDAEWRGTTPSFAISFNVGEDVLRLRLSQKCACLLAQSLTHYLAITKAEGRAKVRSEPTTPDLTKLPGAAMINTDEPATNSRFSPETIKAINKKLSRS